MVRTSAMSTQSSSIITRAIIVRRRTRHAKVIRIAITHKCIDCIDTSTAILARTACAFVDVCTRDTVARVAGIARAGPVTHRIGTGRRVSGTVVRIQDAFVDVYTRDAVAREPSITSTRKRTIRVAATGIDRAIVHGGAAGAFIDVETAFLLAGWLFIACVT